MIYKGVFIELKFLNKMSKKFINRSILITIASLLCTGLLVFAFVYNNSPKQPVNEETTSQEVINSNSEEAINCFNGQTIDNSSLEASPSSVTETIKPSNSSVRVALTFDDGPSTTNTPKLLDGLKKRNTKATFFVLGNKAQNNPEIIKRIYDEGHEIGNHTVNHQHLNTATSEEINTQLVQTNDIIQSMTGFRPTIMRPPAGDYDQRLLSYGMKIILWSIDPRDWQTKNTQTSIDRIVPVAKNGDIILLHDTHQESVDAGLAVIDMLQAKGFQFVTVSELLGESAPVNAVYYNAEQNLK